jgi:general secretion pathway protein D
MNSLRIAPLLLALLLGSCAMTPTTVEQARQQLREGRGEEALALLEQASNAEPGNVALRNEYVRQREVLTTQWLAQAEALRVADQPEVAVALYRRVQRFDAANPRAEAGLAQIALDDRHRKVIQVAEAQLREGKVALAQDTLRPVLSENPRQRDARRLQRQIDERLAPSALAATPLKSTLTQPFTLELRDVSLRSTFDALQRTAGVSFVFDKDVRTDQRISVAVRDASFEDTLNAILLSNQLEHKVVNETTVLVYPGTPQKRREYQELVVKSFYLTNAEAKQTANMIRTVLKTRDIFIDDKLNMIVMKDTAGVVRLAERLIAAQDLAEPEVMLEVEVLEVGRNRLLDLGLRFPSTVAWSLVGAAGVAGQLTLPEWLSRGSQIVRLNVTDPLFLFSLRQEDGTTTVLANPRIRVINREKARVHIGDRVPVITTTAAAAGGFVSESVSYLDVGLKLEVEPLIHLDDEIGIKVGLEVSSIVREVKSTTSNTLTYQIGTRNANTTLRLRDGETQVLAGLISDEDRRTANRVPGIGDLPVIGRLFSHTHDTTSRTEVVLLITPRLLRGLARPEARMVEFSAGTEAASGVGGSGAVLVPPAPPIGGEPQPVLPKPMPTQPQAPSQIPNQTQLAPPMPGTGAAPSVAPTVPMQPFGGIKPTPQ